MRVTARGNETFLFLNGVSVSRAVRMHEHIHLLPANYSGGSDLLSKLLSKDVEFAIGILFLPTIKSQIHVVGDTPVEVGKRAWNSMWDCLLISAVFHCNAICNFQCDTHADKLAATSELLVTNYQLRGLSADKPRQINEAEAKWVEQNFDKARALLDLPGFQNAVHSLASYRWHSLPRAQLALIWSGIEGLFDIDSELVFRLSLYVARFLEPANDARRMQAFKDVKRLYKDRSRAVHGSAIKGDSASCVNESAELLARLIRHCVDDNSLPNLDTLAP